MLYDRFRLQVKPNYGIIYKNSEIVNRGIIEHMNSYKTMSDEELRRLYVPDVYQPDIYEIDYQRLREAGILLISFGVDDTIVRAGEVMPPERAVGLFRELKKSGFTLVLITNNPDRRRASYFINRLNADYIADARKPKKSGFLECRELYYLQYRRELDIHQMAHVGSSLIKDIGGGNTVGATTCLVRRIESESVYFPSDLKSHDLIEVLKERNLWLEDDQYYQLGQKIL